MGLENDVENSKLLRDTLKYVSEDTQQPSENSFVNEFANLYERFNDIWNEELAYDKKPTNK